MKIRNSLICSLVVFFVMLLLMVATQIDSYSWPEPTNDVEFRIRGLLTTMGLVLALGMSLVTFVMSMMVGWIKAGVIYLMNYLLIIWLFFHYLQMY